MRIFACNTDSQIAKLSKLDVLTRVSGMKRGIRGTYVGLGMPEIHL